eukprot:gene4021-2875_t
MPPPSSRVIEGEAEWVTYTREYVLPGILFVAMVYYLVRHIVLPVRDLRTLQAELNSAGDDAEDTNAEAVEDTKKDHVITELLWMTRSLFRWRFVSALRENKQKRTTSICFTEQKRTVVVGENHYLLILSNHVLYVFFLVIVCVRDAGFLLRDVRAVRKPIRVCVLACSYEGSDSALKEFEGDLIQTPQYYFSDADAADYVFDLQLIKKATAYRQIRQLIMSKKYDVFYNQCDGAKDEDRAGVEVVQTLEEFHVPFTGAMSKFYEMSKPDMKMVAHYYNIKTANYALIGVGDDIEKACENLCFPLIIKHMSGYSSIGMDKDSKVFTTEELVPRVERFLEEYQFALVEEFVTGDEATVLACADSSQPGGVRVFHPVMVNFPEGEDFKHFKLKWESYEGMEWFPVPESDPALPEIMTMAKKAFTRMMGGVGYGRVDVRINREKNDVVFLEINPNCGIMYPYGQEGSADWILRLSPDFHQKEFAMLQIKEAIARCQRTQVVYMRKFSCLKGYHLCATCDIHEGQVIFFDEGESHRLCTKPYIAENINDEEFSDFARNAWPIGSDGHYYGLWDHDPAKWRPFNHSCAPNMAFAGFRSLNVCALRDISAGEELTMDYREFMDCTMPPFKCRCNSVHCDGIIVPPRQTSLFAKAVNTDYVLNNPPKLSEESTSPLILVE